MRKRISCFECRRRKVRCDLKDPCSNCRPKDVKCVYPRVDERSFRTTASELKHYKRSVKRLEDVLNTAKLLRDNPDRLIEYLKELDSAEEVCNASSNITSNNEEGHFQDSIAPIMVSTEDSESNIVFGPASIYKQVDVRSSLGPISEEKREGEGKNAVERDHRQFFTLYRFSKSRFDSRLYASISSFFTWQYPSIHLFIHRESFLFHFLQLEYKNTFVSTELVLAMASLGALQSPDDSLREIAEEYSSQARSLLFLDSGEPGTIDFDSSSLTKIQALLCLALYDITKGKLTSGWLISGLALRMCSDLGFEWDPSRLMDSSNNQTHPKYPFELTEVRRRIYWGCYITDHFVSLILGRQPMLRRKETNVLASKDLGDLTNIEEFLFLDKKVNSRYNISAAICTHELAKLIEIGESMLFDVFGPTNETKSTLFIKQAAILSRLEKLDIYNSYLSNWKMSLSAEITWDESSLLRNGYNYIALAPRAYYFLLRLSLNRPFISFGKALNTQLVRSAKICESTIEELKLVLQSIDEVYGAQNFRPIMPLVYSIVLATSILAWKYSKLTEEREKLAIKASANIFINFLVISARSFKIAEDALRTVQDVFHDSSSLNLKVANNFGPKLQNSAVQQSEEEINYQKNICTPFSSFLDGDIFTSAFRPDSAILDPSLEYSTEGYEFFDFLKNSP